MALIAHQTQGSYTNVHLRPLPLTKSVKLKPCLSFQLIRRTEKCIPLKHCFRLSIGGLPIISSSGKLFRISSFKGNTQNDESEGRSIGSKFSKNSVQLSYVPQGKQETMTGSPDVQQVPLTYSSEDGEEVITGSPAIEKLFKKWLIMLRMQIPNHTTDEICVEEPPQSEIPESQHGTLQRKSVEVLKAALGYFLGLDATIKFPLLIFIPWYLAINMVYGAEVSRELTPLWLVGPPILALYIKMVRGLCALYVFSFKQTIRVVKNAPTYSLLVYNYVAEGKLREYIRGRFWQPIVDIKNLDYKELSKRKLKDLEEWVVERYLDYVESIWPLYCRTIRFLKKANLI